MVDGTIADFILVSAALVKLLPVMNIPGWLLIWILIIAVIKITNIIWGYVCKKRYTKIGLIKAVGNYLSQNGVLTDVYLSEKLPEANPVRGKYKHIIVINRELTELFRVRDTSCPKSKKMGERYRKLRSLRG